MIKATTNKHRPDKPEFDIRRVVDDSGNPGFINRVLIGTPMTPTVRAEWVAARYNVTLPVNWSQVEMTQQIPSWMPLNYQVADAQNLIVKHAIENDFQWLLLLENDTIIAQDCFIRINQWMLREDTPVVSGLYFSRTHPSTPLVFRGRGNGVYLDWEQGDVVMCDGVPTGLLLVHVGLLREMWDDSSEYTIYGTVTRRVFDTPREMWDDPQDGSRGRTGGTSDLAWCTRVMEGDYMRRAGWNDYVDNLEDERWPFVCDTGIFAYHQDRQTGEMFP